MRIKGLAIVALTLMALVSATGAFALPTCGAVNDMGAGLVGQTVNAEGGATLTSIVESGNVGGVVFDANTCVGGGLTDCEFTGQGTPNGGVQSLSVDVTDNGAAGPASQTDDASQVPPPAKEPAEPEAYTNTVRWATASESDNFGYHVYRGDSEDGPFEQLTEDPIPGAGNTDETHSYEFVDDTIDPHRAYFYYVETVSMAGVQTRFTPIIQAAPKLPADDAGPDTEGEEDTEGH